MEAEFNHLNHATWECKYHVVFTPKYRKKLLFGKIKRHLGQVFSRSGAPQGMPDRGGAFDAGSCPYADIDTSQVFGGADHRVHEREEFDMDRAECRNARCGIFSATNSGRVDTLSRPLAETRK